MQVCRTRVPTLATLLGVGLLGGCGTPEATDSARLAWHVEETLRIGRVEGQGPDLFGGIRALEVDGEGRLWVLEQQAKELRVFDASGRHVRTVGREGGGPGEFSFPVGLTWDPVGRLMVSDPPNARLSVFDTTGTFVTSHPFPGGLIVNPSPARVDTAGNFYNFALEFTQAGPRAVMVRFDRAMRPVDTLLPPQNPLAAAYFEYMTPDGNSEGRLPVPFTPRLLWRLSPAGDFWAVLTGTYTLLRLSGHGDTLARVTQPFTPVPVTAADVDSAMGSLAGLRPVSGSFDPTRVPEQKPAVDNFWVADDGRVWVAVTTEDPAETRRVFDVFTPEATYLGRVTLPFAIAPGVLPLFRDRKIYAVTEDALGVQYVVVGTIRS